MAKTRVVKDAAYHRNWRRTSDAYKKWTKTYWKENQRRFRSRRKAYYARNKEIWLASHLKQTYRLSLEEFKRLNARQKGLCAICRRTDRAKGRVRLNVDHDHRSLRVRGLLCTRCNAALGGFDDSPKLLRAALRYLEKHA